MRASDQRDRERGKQLARGPHPHLPPQAGEGTITLRRPRPQAARNSQDNFNQLRSGFAHCAAKLPRQFI